MVGSRPLPKHWAIALRDGYLVYDVETVPESELASNWHPDNSNDFAPLWAHKLVVIGALWLDYDLTPMESRVCDQTDERKMLLDFNKLVAKNKIVDFNGRTFDMPVIQYRAWRHGVQLPWYFGPVKDRDGKISFYSKMFRDRWSGHHLDLCDLWSNFGISTRPSLNNLARLMNLPGKEGFDGSDIAEAYATGRIDEINHYCMRDVYQTGFIFLRYLFISGELTVAEYNEKAKKLLRHIAEQPNFKKWAKGLDRKSWLTE